MKNLALVLLFAACGDNKAAPDAHVSGDAPDIDAAPVRPKGFVVSGDFQPAHPGVSAMVDIDKLSVAKNAAPAGAVGDDPVVRQFGNELFVVNRKDGNNVTILDASTRMLVEQLGTGPGGNPQDVAIIGNKLYVPVYDGAGVAILTRGSSNVDLIDLSAEDPDGHPECESIYLVGNDLYVACQLLDPNYAPRGPGKIFVIDPATKAIKQRVTMQTPNPFTLFERLSSGELVIGTVSFADGSGCIERVTTGATPATTCLLMNSQLGGYASRIDVQAVGSTGLYMLFAVSTTYPNGNIQVFDVMTGCLWPSPVTPMSEQIVDVGGCPDGTVIGADQTMASGGIRIYKNAQEITGGPLAVGLVPKSTHGIVCY